MILMHVDVPAWAFFTSPPQSWLAHPDLGPAGVLACCAARARVQGMGGLLLLADPPTRTARNRERFLALVAGGGSGMRLAVDECSVQQCEVGRGAGDGEEKVGGREERTHRLPLVQRLRDAAPGKMKGSGCSVQYTVCCMGPRTSIQCAKAA